MPQSKAGSNRVGVSALPDKSRKIRMVTVAAANSRGWLRMCGWRTSPRGAEPSKRQVASVNLCSKVDYVAFLDRCSNWGTTR